MSLITDNIDYLLEKRGLDKKELFSAVGITAQAYSQWKNEQSQPRLDKIFKIAEVLEVEPADILSKDLQNKKAATQMGDGLTDTQNDLLNIIRQLDPDAVRFLKAKAQELADFQRFRDSQ